MPECEHSYNWVSSFSKKARNLDLFKIRYHLIYKHRRLIIIDRVCGQENHNIRARFTLSYQSVNSTLGYTLCKSRKSWFFSPVHYISTVQTDWPMVVFHSYWINKCFQQLIKCIPFLLNLCLIRIQKWDQHNSKKWQYAVRFCEIIGFIRLVSEFFIYMRLKMAYV